MAPRKKRPVLYEVFRPKAEGVKPPRQPLGTTTPSPTPSPRTVSPVAPISVPAGGSARAEMPVTISRTTLAVLLAVVIALWLIAFVAGRRYEALHPSDYQPIDLSELTETPPNESAAGNSETQPPAPEASVNDSASQAERKPEETPIQTRPRVTLQRGYTYIVVQHFNKNRQRADAEAAALFLRTQGIECAILEGPDIRLVTTTGFLIEQDDHAAAQAQQRLANQLQERIKQLGQQYNRELARQGKRGYSFTDCYPHLIK